MRDSDKDIIRPLGITLFIITCFLFVFTVSDTSASHSPDPFQYEFLSASLSNNSDACVAEDIQLPSPHKSCVTIHYNDIFNCFDKNYKIGADNRAIAQSLVSLHMIHRFIRPDANCRFHFLQFLTDSEEPPYLG